MSKCFRCKFWVFSQTLSSMPDKEWHCKDGFTPSPDCIEMAEYNRRVTREFYKNHPEYLQLCLNF